MNQIEILILNQYDAGIPIQCIARSIRGVRPPDGSKARYPLSEVKETVARYRVEPRGIELKEWGK